VTFSTDLQAIIIIRNSGLLSCESVSSDRHLEGSKCRRNVGNRSPNTASHPRRIKSLATPLLRTSNPTYNYNLSQSQAQWSTVRTHPHYTVGRISLQLVCVCVCTCARMRTCTYVHLQWNLHPPFLKGPQTAKK